jgi:hypothetical protein
MARAMMRPLMVAEGQIEIEEGRRQKEKRARRVLLSIATRAKAEPPELGEARVTSGAKLTSG